MPLLTDNTVPSYRRHKQSGQAIVTLNGRDILLGPHGTAASRGEYRRRIAEWLASDRQALRPLRLLYGPTAAADFGPLKLEAVRNEMVQLGWCRTNINSQINRIKHVFKWAVSRELIPASVHHALVTVASLRFGRSDARESEPVRPVFDSIVDATLVHLSPTVQAIVQLQRLTGARPGEICSMQIGEIDRSTAVWAVLHQHVHPRSKRIQRLRRVQAIRSRNYDRVEFHRTEHFPMVRKGRADPILRPHFFHTLRINVAQRRQHRVLIRCNFRNVPPLANRPAANNPVTNRHPVLLKKPWAVCRPHGYAQGMYI